MAKKIFLNTDFIDHKTMKQYAKGEDVSHLPEDQIKFLTDNNHITDESPAKAEEAEAGEVSVKKGKK